MPRNAREHKKEKYSYFAPGHRRRWFRCNLAGQTLRAVHHRLHTPSLERTGPRTPHRRRSFSVARAHRRADYGRQFPLFPPWLRRFCPGKMSYQGRERVKHVILIIPQRIFFLIRERPKIPTFIWLNNSTSS